MALTISKVALPNWAAAYGLAADTPEPEIVARLFKLYAEMTKGG